MIGIAVVLTAGVAFALRQFEGMKKLSVAELRAYFQPGGDWLFYDRVIRELRRRGESIHNPLISTLALLADESSNRRIAGWLILQKHFPDAMKKLAGYQPTGDADACRQRVHEALTGNELAAIAAHEIGTPAREGRAIAARRRARLKTNRRGNGAADHSRALGACMGFEVRGGGVGVRVRSEDRLLAIHHVGSTSVERLHAKLTIDILVVLRETDTIDECDDAMETRLPRSRREPRTTARAAGTILSYEGHRRRALEHALAWLERRSAETRTGGVDAETITSGAGE